MVNETKNPWTTLASKDVHESPWIKVTQHDVLNPAGQPSTYSTVHFKNLAVGVIPLDADGNTWIVGQYRYPVDCFSWEIPEGGGPQGETPIDTAKRELLEETGIEAARWEKFMEFHTSNSATDEHVHLFVARDLTFHDPHPDEDEEIVVRKVAFEELYQMVMRNEVWDSLTIAGVLKLKALLDAGEL